LLPSFDGSFCLRYDDDMPKRHEDLAEIAAKARELGLSVKTGHSDIPQIVAHTGTDLAVEQEKQRQGYVKCVLSHWHVSPSSAKLCGDDPRAHTGWGRETVWTEEVPDLFEAYINSKEESYRDIVEQSFDKDGNVKTKVHRVVTPFPMVEEFTVKNKIDRDTFNEWCKDYNVVKYSRMFALKKRLVELQKRYLAVNGLLGLHNPLMSGFVAKHIVGMKEDEDGEASTVLNINEMVKQVETSSEAVEETTWSEDE